MGTDRTEGLGIGRPPREVRAEIIRDLTAADLARLGEARGVRPPALRRLTDMHHSLARLVAVGEPNYTISLTTGYSESRISILKADPAFQELVARYRAETEEVRSDYYAATAAKLCAINLDGLEILHDQMLEGLMDTRQVQDTVRMSLDRSGFGPASKSTNTNLNVDIAGQIAEGRARVVELHGRIAEAQAAKVLPFEPPGGRDAPLVAHRGESAPLVTTAHHPEPKPKG